jgi:RNA polymerase sigma-70 factor (ECF subfamily)
MQDVNGEAAPGPEGVPASFEQAYEAHARDVVRVCRRLLGGREEARDAPQDVFLRASQAYSSYDPKRPFRPWLLAIAGNYCIDQLRRQAAQHKIFASIDPDETAPPPGTAPSPLGHLIAREERDLLGRAIAKLPLKYRLPLALRYFSELDYAAIAAELDVTPNQVGTLLFRAKRQLREEIREAAGRPSRSSSGRRS